MRHTWSVMMAVSLAGPSLCSASPEGSAGAVADWSRHAQNAIVGVAKKFPGEAAVHMGIVHAAMYDAAVAVKGGYRPYHAEVVAPPGASLDAAVASAAHGVLVQRFPGQQGALDAAYEASLAAIPDGQAKADGIAAGEAVAADIVLLRQGDRLDEVVPFVPPSPGAGVYQTTGPPQPLGTQLPLVRPLALEGGAQFRPDGPNALTGDDYAADLEEVKLFGRVDSPARTEEQTRTALFWTDHDIPQWNRNLLLLAAARSLGPVATARMLALVHVAGGDAMVACFDAKYHYLFWRPVHAIRGADTDGNPATEPDPTWQPLRPTPNHPEYPSAHACHSSAIREALRAYFGTDNVRFSLDSLVTGETRYYDRFKDAVKEVNAARVWAGFHFQNSDLEGTTLGRKVGRYVAEHFFQPLP